MACKAFPDATVTQAQLARAVRPERTALRVQVVRLVHSDHLGHLVHQVRVAHPEHPVHQVRLENPVRLASQGPKVQLVDQR